jgi:hypothetical protein
MQPPGSLPAEVRHFVYTVFDSIEQLEILVRLKAVSGGWTVRDASRSVGATPEVVRASLEALVARGLLKVRVAEPSEPSVYWYEPRNPAFLTYVDVLVQHYDTDRTEVVELIASGQRRLRQFADAFKLRGPKS